MYIYVCVYNIYIYIYKIAIFLCVCLSVCSCLNAGLTAARINLIFGMHTHIGAYCAIGYMILTEVIKGHFRSKYLRVEHWRGQRGEKKFIPNCNPLSFFIPICNPHS